MEQHTEEIETLLEHLGTQEVKQMATNPTLAINQTLLFVIPGLMIGVTAVGSLAAGLAIQTIDLDSTYPPLITAFLLLAFFYSLYETYRVIALFQMQSIDAQIMQRQAINLLSKLAGYKARLTTLFHQAGIDPTNPDVDDDDDNNSSSSSSLVLSDESAAESGSNRNSVSDRVFAPRDTAVASARQSIMQIPVVEVAVAVAVAATVFDAPATSRQSFMEFEPPSNWFIAIVTKFIDNYGYCSWYVMTSTVIMFGILCAVRVVGN